MCPKGTYSGALGNRNVSDCVPCVAGFYCPYAGMSNGTMFPCNAGYFCPAGMSVGSPSGHGCGPGFFCPQGSGVALACPPGFFQENYLASDCTACVAGYYCVGTANDTSRYAACPPGYFCLSAVSFPSACPPGSFSGSSRSTNCTDCPVGFTCRQSATVQPVVCPAGFYCMANNPDPVPCPVGTYSSSSGIRFVQECRPCPNGSYCGSLGQTAPTQQCLAGYLCESGANESAGLANLVTLSGLQKSGACPAGSFCWTGATLPSVCPAGTFCSGGQTRPAPCEVGTYNMYPNQTACMTCPAGYLCSPALYVP